MKKNIIISSIATLTLITGAILAMPTNTNNESADITAPEPAQHVIEAETIIDTPEVVEAVAEPVSVPVVEVIEDTVELRPYTFDELVEKYGIDRDSEFYQVVKKRYSSTPKTPQHIAYEMTGKATKESMDYLRSVQDMNFQRISGLRAADRVDISS